MARVCGHFLETTTLGESVQSFVPESLPPQNPPLDEGCYVKQNLIAEHSLAQLSGVTALAPSIDWLLYGAIRKEALLTSLIEGTQATLTDLFNEEAGLDITNNEDIEEVTNYMKAFKYVRENLKSDGGLPISIRLLCNAHQLLLNGVRGTGKQPGELRKSQNWIGGTKPKNAVFVPPPPEKITELLGQLEIFIHSTDRQLPPLVKIALIHAQFETIHPFLDGNGRIGRLLIAALMEHYDLLPEPLLYLSAHLKEHQSEYYRLLNGVRTEGNWEAWIDFFLEGVIDAANKAKQNIIDIAEQIAKDKKILLHYEGVNSSCIRLFELLPVMPRFTIERVKTELGVSFPTANAAVKSLNELGIIKEMSGRTRNRSFSYESYIQLISQ